MRRTQVELDIAFLVKKFGRSKRRTIKKRYLEVYGHYSGIKPLSPFAHMFALDQVEKEMENKR